MTRFSSLSASSSAERFLASSLLVASKSSPSHIFVDLASTRVESALRTLSNIPKLGKKVKKATVHANTLVENPGRFGRVNFEAKHIQYVFEALAKLPNLHSLTIELNFHVISFPIAALLVALETKKLKRLTLKHLLFHGDDKKLEDLRQLARQQTSLKSLTLDCCRGVAGIRALIYNLPRLQELRVSNSALSPSVGTIQQQHDKEVDMVNLVTPTLSILKLDDVLELDDNDCVALANALADSQVEELHLASSMISTEATHAITSSLKLIKSLRKLTLHLDCDDVGIYIARVISDSSSLECVDLRLHNDADSVSFACGLMAEALESNSCNLQHLRLRLDIELESLPDCVVDNFARALHTNTVLQTLSLDDGIYRYPLSLDMRLKLALNECGCNQLLQQTTTASPNDWVDALIRNAEKEAPVSASSRHTSLDVAFSILSNVPELALSALNEISKTNVTTSIPTGGKPKKQQANHTGWRLPRSLLLRAKKIKFSSAPSA